jgi:hypothetical protein
MYAKSVYLSIRRLVSITSATAVCRSYQQLQCKSAARPADNGYDDDDDAAADVYDADDVDDDGDDDVDNDLIEQVTHAPYHTCFLHLKRRLHD